MRLQYSLTHLRSDEARMENILANYSISIEELQANVSSIIDELNDEPIAVIENNKPTAYLVSSEMYENMKGEIGVKYRFIWVYYYLNDGLVYNPVLPRK